MLKLHSTCSLYFQLIDIIIGYYLIIVILCASNGHFQMILSTGKSSAYHDGLLTPLLSPRNLTALEISTNGFNVSSDLIEVNNKPKRFSVLRQQSTTVKQPIYPFIKDLISLSSDSIESGKNNGNNGNTNKTVDGDENLWNYRLLSSSVKANDSAIVEDIFNRFKKPTQSFEIRSPINKQIKSEKISFDVNDESIKEDDETEKSEQKDQSPGSVYFDNNWFLNRNRQGNTDRMVNRDFGFPVSNSKSSLLPTSQPMINQQNTNNSDNNGDNYSNNNLDNSKIGSNVSVDLKDFPDKSTKEPLFGMPDPGRWYYTKNILNAEPSKVGSTEAKVRTKETKETIKSELTNGVSSSSPLDKTPHLSNYPIFDEQLIMTAPHHQYLPNLPHLPHRDLHHVIPHHLNHNHYHHHAHPYRFAYHPFNHPVLPPPHHHQHLLLHHHHSIRRYPKLGPIAYSCCKLVYPPNGLAKSAIGHTLIPHGSVLNKETVPASASTTPSESVHGLAHEIGANCIPIYPAGYPFGYGPRYVKTFPLALKFFKKALLFG